MKEFVKQIIEEIAVIDDVLSELGQPPVLSNIIFSFDEMTSERWLKLCYKNNTNVSFSFILSPFGVQIDIDRAQESFEMSFEQFLGDKKALRNFVYLLFTCKITVEYCGDNYTKLTFVDKTGEHKIVLKEVTGLYLNINCSSKHYPPIVMKDPKA